jgi:hypothetical protein
LGAAFYLVLIQGPLLEISPAADGVNFAFETCDPRGDAGHSEMRGSVHGPHDFVRSMWSSLFEKVEESLGWRILCHRCLFLLVNQLSPLNAFGHDFYRMT